MKTRVDLENTFTWYISMVATSSSIHAMHVSIGKASLDTSPTQRKNRYNAALRLTSKSRPLFRCPEG